MTTPPMTFPLPPVLLLDDMAQVMRTSTRTIKRGLRAGTFPIRPIRGIDKKIRFAGGDVERFLSRKGGR